MPCLAKGRRAKVFPFKDLSGSSKQQVKMVALPRNHGKPLILKKKRRLFHIRFKAPWAAQVTYR